MTFWPGPAPSAASALASRLACVFELRVGPRGDALVAAVVDHRELVRLAGGVGGQDVRHATPVLGSGGLAITLSRFTPIVTITIRDPGPRRPRSRRLPACRAAGPGRAGRGSGRPGAGSAPEPLRPLPAATCGQARTPAPGHPPRAAAGVSAETLAAPRGGRRFRGNVSSMCVTQLRRTFPRKRLGTGIRHVLPPPRHLQPPRHLADPSGAGGHDHFPSGNTGVWGSGCSAFRSLAGAGWRGCCRGCRGWRGWRGGWDGWCPEGCSGAGRTGVTMITSCAVTTAAASDQRGASGLRLGHERLAVRARATRGCGPGRLLAAPCCRRRSAC